MTEHDIILVNENDEPVGTMEKMEAHRRALLHRAFSVFIFNSRGELLLQQRAKEKYHSAGLWTNACCSHPRPGEDTVAAASRRLREEMGFSAAITEIFSFTYRSEFDNGLTEYEFDHVFAGVYDGPIHPDPNEVAAYRYQSMGDVRMALDKEPSQFTTWFNIAFPLLEKWHDEQKAVKEAVSKT
ncbi:MAG: isopentenyl-diphosphate Delta-isomerase [Bacteroidota bacterium]|nr:isopentenyl-diphosphate Delta-isomerase [Bacteroidota bacterium]